MARQTARDQGRAGRIALVRVSLGDAIAHPRALRPVRVGLVALLARVAAVCPPADAGGAPVPAAVEIRPRITGHRAALQGGLRLPALLAHRCATVDRIQYELVSTIAIFGLGIKADGNLDTELGRLPGVHRRRRRGDHERRPRQGRPRRPDVPALRLGQPARRCGPSSASTTAQTRFIAQALDLMDARKADGANLDFEPMFDEDARVLPRVRVPVPHGAEGPLPDRHARQRHVGRRRQGPHPGPRPARRPAR